MSDELGHLLAPPPLTRVRALELLEAHQRRLAEVIPAATQAAVDEGLRIMREEHDARGYLAEDEL